MHIFRQITMNDYMFRYYFSEFSLICVSLGIQGPRGLLGPRGSPGPGGQRVSTPPI